MISEINTQCPFDIPGLFWREGRFSVSAATTMTTSADPLGRIEIVLPDDLISAGPKRRSEFLAGRLCAALALRAAGQPIAVGRNGRAPTWPPGLAGSITHSDCRAIAVVSLTHSAIGVDCETIMPEALAIRLHAEILHPQETELRPDNMPFASFLTVIFSAKEAIYKALARQLETIPAFLDVVLITFTSDKLYLVLHGRTMIVHYRMTQTECVTLMVVDG